MSAGDFSCAGMIIGCQCLISSLKQSSHCTFIFPKCLYNIYRYLFYCCSKLDMFFLKKIIFASTFICLSKLSLVHFVTRLNILASHLILYSLCCPLFPSSWHLMLLICLKYLFLLTPIAP